MNKFTSFLAPLMQAYIFYRKTSGHWNETSYEPNLLLFDRYCKKQTQEAVLLSQEMVDGAISATRKPTIHADQEFMLLQVLYDT